MDASSSPSTRQLEVLQLVATGLADKEIAARLGISLAGAKKHVAVLLERYGCANRAALVYRAMDRGWIGRL